MSAAQRELQEIRQRAASAPKDAALQKSLDTKKEEIRQLESQRAEAAAELRQCWEDLEATKHAYVQKVAELTKLALQAHR
jgi:hypothetical protein